MNAQLKPLELVIAAVPASMIDLVWEQVTPLIQKVIDKAPDDVTLEATRENLINANTLLVTVSRGAKIVAVNILNVQVLDSGKRVLTIPVIGGEEMREWMDRFMEIAEQIAKDFDCTAIRGFAAREGWARVLEPYGYKKLHTVLQYEIEEKT
jgi:hypothetical protein